MLVNLDGDIADHVFVDVGLAFQFGDNIARSVNVQHHIMRLAVLGDFVSKLAKTPGFGLGDLALIVFNDFGGGFRQRIDLGLGQILTREKYMLVKRHGVYFLRWPIAGIPPHADTPPAVVSGIGISASESNPAAVKACPLEILSGNASLGLPEGGRFAPVYLPPAYFRLYNPMHRLTRLTMTAKWNVSLFGKPLSPRLVAIIGLISGAATLLLWLWSEIGEGELRHFDEVILLAFRHPDAVGQMVGPLWLKQTMLDFTSLGSSTLLSLVIVGATAFALTKRAYRIAFLAAGAPISGAILVALLKVQFGRARPTLVDPMMVESSASFPSGHTANSAIVYLTIAVLLMRVEKKPETRMFILMVAVLLTSLVGISRVALGVHWPSDVLGGWLFGTAWACLWALVIRHPVIEDATPAPSEG